MRDRLRELARKAKGLVGGDTSRASEASRREWDGQYRDGQWEYLKNLDELAHYSVIAGYYCHLKQGGSILDVCCGEGILQERLRPYGYSRYVGVDVSAEAIRLASQRQDERTAFECDDAHTFTPAGRFDVIVFNEALYYFADPAAGLARYKKFLEADGVIVVSMYVSEGSGRIWENVDQHCATIDAVTVTNGRGTSWIIKALRPI